MCISVQPLSTASRPASENLLVAHQVAFVATQIGPKRTEHAAINADVGRVQVRVDVVVRGVAVDPLAHQVGQFADFVPIGVSGDTDTGRRRTSAARRREPCANRESVNSFSRYSGPSRIMMKCALLSSAGDSVFRCIVNPRSKRATMPTTAADADHRIDFEKRHVDAREVVWPDQVVLVGQQPRDTADPQAVDPTEQRIDPRQQEQQQTIPRWHRAARRKARRTPSRAGTLCRPVARSKSTSWQA